MRKAAVIGCGRMGAFTSESVRRFSPACWFPLAHAEAIMAHPDLELAALCDADPANLERARAAYGNVPGYTDYRLLAEEVRPDLAGIATRTIGRADITQALHAHGTRAFHIEKPLCNSVAELEALTPLLESPDVFATYGTVRRFFHIYRAARDLVRSGRFGKLLEIRANFGAGALYWVQPHAIDLILFAAEGREVTGVQARFDRLDPGESPDEVLNDPVIQSATIWFDDGVAGHIGRAPGLDLVLSCELGEVMVASDGRGILIAEPRGEDPYLAREPWTGDVPGQGPEGSLAPIAQLAACLAGDADAIAANASVKRDILRGQRLAFAMIDSHRQGSAIVPVPASPPPLFITARTGTNAA
jgi:scyllo-inositol 2-dehydrogenase (NAD+)